MDCPPQWNNPCIALETSIIEVSSSNSITTSWSFIITTSLGTTPATSCSICDIALPVNPPMGKGLPFDYITLYSKTNGCALWSPIKGSSPSSLFITSFMPLPLAIFYPFHLTDPFATHSQIFQFSIFQNLC